MAEKKNNLTAAVSATREIARLIAIEAQYYPPVTRREGLDRRSVRRLIRLGFLSPRIVEMIAEGRQSPDMTVRALVRRLNLSVLWSTQEYALVNAGPIDACP